MEGSPVKKKLSGRETIAVASMLFGLFFGAGNLIFPVYMGQQAGKHVASAVAGFLITGVGIPLLAIAALGSSRSDGLQELAQHVGPRYGLFFTGALYLTIGPFFAIPRCASTAFSVGILPMTGSPGLARVLLWVFSLLFFAAVLWFSLRPGNILTWVGKVLTPLFLVFLGVLLAAALARPMGAAAQAPAAEGYRSGAFFHGFLEGYNTMDALAGLAFGIVVVNVIRSLGVTEPGAVAVSALRSGVLGCAVMALIYILLALAGARSRVLYPVSADGGAALHLIASHYFHTAGAVILALIVTFACLKTAVGLITSCAEAFEAMFPGRFQYRTWASSFCVISFLIANLGLNAIISCSLPVLMFLYPQAITLILLALCHRVFDGDRRVYLSTGICTLAAAVFDFLNALPDGVKAAFRLEPILRLGRRLPFFHLGLGWVCPALLGFVLGMALHVRGGTSKGQDKGPPLT